MSTLKNTSFIDSELSARKTKRENKDGIIDVGIGVRHIFVFLGVKNYKNLQVFISFLQDFLGLLMFMP